MPGAAGARRHRERGRAAGQGDAAARQPAPGRRAADRLQTRPHPRRPQGRPVRPEHRRSGPAGSPASGWHRAPLRCAGRRHTRLSPGLRCGWSGSRAGTGANGPSLGGSDEDQDEPLPFDDLTSDPGHGPEPDPPRLGEHDLHPSDNDADDPPEPGQGQLCPAPPAASDAGRSTHHRARRHPPPTGTRRRSPSRRGSGPPTCPHPPTGVDTWSGWTGPGCCPRSPCTCT